MKLYAGLLVLSALQGTIAFAPQSTKAFTTNLGSSMGGNDRTSTSSGVGANPMEALGGRLASLGRKERSSMSGPVMPQAGSSGESANGALQFYDTATQIKVQGGSLKTWSFINPAVERVQVVMKTDGRPLDADVELWQGPDNTPTKMRVYVEDGDLRPFSAVIETPRGPNSISIRNIGQLEFPLDACVEADTGDNGIMDPMMVAESSERGGQIIQGGALKTYPFDPMVQSVVVLLRTDGRPLNSRIELLQGPNNNKQVIEVYTEDGMDRPFFVMLETPGSGNVVRVVNTSSMEFPITAWVEAGVVGNSGSYSDVVIS